jgi:hypothetical protein
MIRETGFLSQDCFNEIFERGSEILKKWNAWIFKFASNSGIGASVASLARTTKWKLIAKWPRWLFRAYGPRFATPEERATANFVRSLKQDILDFKRVEQRIRESIGKSSKWLDDSRDHLLSPQDIWNRIRIDLNISDDLNLKILVIRGTDPSVIIAEGLSNAILVFRLINEYCIQLNQQRGHILKIELADAGLLDISVTSRECGSWHLGPQAFAIAALDLETKERAEVISIGRTLLGSLTGVPRLIGSNQYDVGRDLVLVECSCTYDILNRTTGESAKGIGKNLSDWKRQNPEHRIPAILEYGSCSVAFRGESAKTKKESQIRAKALDRLIGEIATIAGEHGIDTSLEPLRAPRAADYRDGTLDVCQADIDDFGACSIFSNLDDLSAVPDPLPLPVAQDNVLIVCAQICLLRGPAVPQEDPHHYPRVVKLVLSNAFGNVLVYHVDMEEPGIYPEGYEDGQQGGRKDWRYMRSSIIEYLGKNCMLVGFGISWILTALQLPLEASRVIDIGEEPAFQRWCKQLAGVSKTPRLADHMARNLAIPYDSRWPAILQPEPLELALNGKPDIFRRTLYTAAVWQVVRTRIAEDRAKLEVYYARSLYKVGCGLGYSDRDLLFFAEAQNLTYRAHDKLSIGSLHWPAFTDLASTALSVIAQAEEFPSHPITWSGADSGEHAHFIKQCAAMVQRWKQQVLPGDHFPRDLGNYGTRSQVAVNLSIGSMRIRDSLDLSCAWINNHYVHTNAQLAGIDPADPKFSTEGGRNLIVCFADLAMEAPWFDHAYNPRPGWFDPRNRTEAEGRKETAADPLRGAPKHFRDKPAEVPAHFITPPPRRFRTPTPVLPDIPIIPRQVGEPRKRRKWIPASEGNSYGRYVSASEGEEDEDAAAAAAAATPLTPEAAQAAELRAKGVQWTEALYQAQKKVAAAKAAEKAATAERAASPPPPAKTPEPREHEKSPRRSPRHSPKKK